MCQVIDGFPRCQSPQVEARIWCPKSDNIIITLGFQPINLSNTASDVDCYQTQDPPDAICKKRITYNFRIIVILQNDSLYTRIHVLKESNFLILQVFLSVVFQQLRNLEITILSSGLITLSFRFFLQNSSLYCGLILLAPQMDIWFGFCEESLLRFSRGAPKEQKLLYFNCWNSVTNYIISIFIIIIINVW